MIILWSILLVTAASAHKVVESTEDIGPEAFANVTTLYPVANAAPTTNSNDDNIILNNTNNEINGTSKSKEEKSKPEATGWKIEAAFAESNLETENNTTPEDTKNETKEFRPSQHLGSFVDILKDVPMVKPTYSSFTPVTKQPASGFVSSKEEYRSTINKIPKELFNTHKEYPYKFESSIFTRSKDNWRPDRHKPWPHSTGLEGLGNRPEKEWVGNSGGSSPSKHWGQGNSGLDSLGDRPGKGWAGNPGSHGIGDRPKGWSLDSLETEPTQQSPLKVPAGGLYKYPDPFKEKPGNHDEDFGLEFNNDGKDSSIKKRGNPWKGVLRMLTAFIPVGLIISALTPSIITIENTAPDSTYPSNMFRRSGDLSELPAISERCRRRLLCELHSENNYDQHHNSAYPRKWKQCHRIRCEDQEALARSLRWLL